MRSDAIDKKEARKEGFFLNLQREQYKSQSPAAVFVFFVLSPALLCGALPSRLKELDFTMAIDPTLAELARKTNCDKQICRKCVLCCAAPSFCAPRSRCRGPTAREAARAVTPPLPERGLTLPRFPRLVQVLRPPSPSHDQLPQEEVRPLQPAPTEEEAPLIVVMVSCAACASLPTSVFVAPCLASGLRTPPRDVADTEPIAANEINFMHHSEELRILHMSGKPTNPNLLNEARRATRRHCRRDIPTTSRLRPHSHDTTLTLPSLLSLPPWRARRRASHTVISIELSLQLLTCEHPSRRAALPISVAEPIED